MVVVMKCMKQIMAAFFHELISRAASQGNDLGYGMPLHVLI